ncbi:MAG: ATP phosphoribosyltransferase regulatory subunit [Pseudomonadota bacterium]
MTPDALRDRAADVFARLGGDLVDPPTLMDATVPLDLSGEAVRSRLCVFPDARGKETALRPDLTLPVALAEADARRQDRVTGETIRRYVARAFRMPVADGFDTEFTQVGFERYGAPSDTGTDTETFAVVLEAATVGAPQLGKVMVGDLAVFPALIDAVADSDTLAETLKRRFRQGGGVDAPEGETTGHDGSAAMARVLAGASRTDAEALVAQMLALAGVSPVGDRGFDEIVERLLAKASSGTEKALSDAGRALLSEALGLNGPAKPTAEALGKLVKSAKLKAVMPVVERLQARLDEIAALAPGLDLRFATRFGQRFNYYDGFLFEIFGEGAPELAPLAAGGRYDQLVSVLSGGAATVTAIGGVVRPDRMALAQPDAGRGGQP